MKSHIYTLFIIGIIILSGCKKNTEHEVEIVLEKGTTYRHVLNKPYTDPGAYGLDFNYERLTVDIDTSELDINTVGTYKIYYTATDDLGNIGTAERSVTVYNEAEYLEGNWSFYKYIAGTGVSDTLYIETIEASATINKRFVFTKFSSYKNSAIEAYINANLIVIDSLQYSVGEYQDINITFYGNGLQYSSNRLEIYYSEIRNDSTKNYSAIITRDY